MKLALTEMRSADHCSLRRAVVRADEARLHCTSPQSALSNWAAQAGLSHANNTATQQQPYYTGEKQNRLSFCPGSQSQPTKVRIAQNRGERLLSLFCEGSSLTAASDVIFFICLGFTNSLFMLYYFNATISPIISYRPSEMWHFSEVIVIDHIVWVKILVS